MPTPKPVTEAKGAFVVPANARVVTAGLILLTICNLVTRGVVAVIEAIGSPLFIAVALTDPLDGTVDSDSVQVHYPPSLCTSSSSSTLRASTFTGRDRVLPHTRLCRLDHVWCDREGSHQAARAPHPDAVFHLRCCWMRVPGACLPVVVQAS